MKPRDPHTVQTKDAEASRSGVLVDRADAAHLRDEMVLSAHGDFSKMFQIICSLGAPLVAPYKPGSTRLSHLILRRI